MLSGPYASPVVCIMAENSDPLQGFRRISSQIYVRDPDSSEEKVSDSAPTTIIVYGWGDGQPRHVAKYADGYHVLYPSARLIVVLTPILGTFFQTPAVRIQSMAPIIDTVFGAGRETESEERLLVHIMSNMGATSFASTLCAYRRAKKAAMPHRLFVLDSTPGSTGLRPNLAPWSRALSLGMARYLPWPFAVTQGFAAAFLVAMHGLALLTRTKPAAVFAMETIADPETTVAARRLYIYSKEDDLIRWQDVEDHAAKAKQQGVSLDMELFEGTGHVSHMRADPQRYWGAIEENWRMGSKAVD